MGPGKFHWLPQSNLMNYKAVNAQVASGRKVPTKPGGCNRSHIPKVLEHPTGLPNLQPSHEPPAPSPLQAPVTLKPDGIGGKKMLKRKGGIGREC